MSFRFERGVNEGGLLTFMLADKNCCWEETDAGGLKSNRRRKEVSSIGQKYTMSLLPCEAVEC